MFKKRPGFLAGLAFALALVALMGFATAVVRIGQANTYTGGFLNDFSAAKLKPPTATVATLPAAAAGNVNQMYLVTDGASLNDCTVGMGAVRVWCVSNASAWIAIPAPTDATLPFTDVTTGNATSTAHGFLIKSPADATQFLNGGATPGFSAITTPVITAMTTLHANDTAAYCLGGGYTLTTTPAAVDCVTTDPAITIAAAGTYLITYYGRADNSAATYAAYRTILFNVNRTNNTPDIVSTNTAIAGKPALVTTGDNTAMTGSESFFYTTTNSNDVLAVFGSVSVLPSAGITVAVGWGITATRLY